MTAKELYKLAHDKDYFGAELTILYAFEDGNMYASKKDAEHIHSINGIKYHVIEKGKEIKEASIEAPKEEIKEFKKSKNK